jgi:hypothetical protein
MFSARSFAIAFCGALLLTACAQASASDAPVKPMAAPSNASAAPTSLGAASAGETYDPAEDSQSTGTAVGQKVQSLRAELDQLDSAAHSEAATLQQLRQTTRESAADYFNAVAAIDAKLQVGTTTGNPILIAQWNQAQAKLDVLSQNVGSLNSLSTQIAGSASKAAYILDSVRATFGLSGAVDEDHVHLAALEDDVNRTVVLIDRLLNEISGDLSRQSSYVSAERRNLQTLSLAINNGELYGQSLANRPYMSGFSSSGTAPATSHDSGRPLVVIRFDRNNVNYQHAVYQAVSQALDRYPQASFDVVAVSPTGGNAAEGALAAEDAKRNADGVARTLSQMGLPSGRIQMSASTSSTATLTEVRIYVH